MLDIASRPENAKATTDTLAILQALYPALGGALAIVSGRRIEDIDTLFAPLRLPASGIHGAQLRRAPEHPISDAGIPVNILPKLASGQRPNVIDLMKNKDMALVINTPSGKNPREDEIKIRTAAMQNRVPIMTTLRGADAALKAIKSLQASEVQVRALQEYHK